MLRMRILLSLVLAPACLAGCSDGEAVGPDALSSGAAAALLLTGASGSTVDISGDWTWSNLEVLAFPPFVAALLGIDAEGRLTHARCESAGTMTLMQTGAAFEGTAIRTFNSCATKGGQPFQQPSSNFDIAHGRITGGSIHFSFSSPLVTPCPHHAVVSAVQDGVVGALSGTGRCILPGHPHSDVPFSTDPPLGTSKTVRWEAVRP
jgi:hypothetical protein